MGEQLWYTWSDSGFGIATDYRVRAASRGLMDTEGERVRALVSLVGYQLPQDTDLYLPPKEAPRCLAFLRAGSRREPVLIYKTYIGIDEMKRPGNYFSHLLAELPAVSSPRPEGQIEFSAREAIELWGSKSLNDKDSERIWLAGRRDLEQFSLDDLKRNRGSLTRHDLEQMVDLFRHVFSAFLTLPKLGEGKRLYIAAPPDTVAALIWGLTHALPRTLNLMRTLTFSTFERNIEDKAAPVIVGTCWLPQYARSGPNTPQDLPPAYYQPNNPYGLAINGYQPVKVTPFTPDPPEITKFVELAIDCFVQRPPHTMEELNDLVDGAEGDNVTEVEEFIRYIKDTIPPGEIIDILSNLLSKARGVIQKAKLILEQGKPLSSLEMPRWKDVQPGTKAMRRENVRRSILRWMTEDPVLWREQCRPLLSQLCQLAEVYNEDTLVKMGSRFTNQIVTSAAWHKDQGKSMSSSLRQLTQNQAGDDPGTILTSFAQDMIYAIQMAQEELAIALIPLASDLAAKVWQAIGRDDAASALFWADALDAITPARAEVEVWIPLLQQFAAQGMVFTSAYQQWWTQYGKDELSRLRPLVDQSRESELARAYSSFQQKAMMELQANISNGQPQSLAFWEDVLAISAPYTSEPGLWLSLLQQLGRSMYTDTGQHWWREQGKAAAVQVARIAERDLQSNLARTLVSFLGEVMKELHTQIVDETLKPGEERRVRIAFLLDLLATATPSTDPNTWNALLNKLSPGPQRIYDTYSWDLRALLLQTWGKIPALRKHDLILLDWLFIRWSELGKLLKLELPKEWSTRAIARLVITTIDIPLQEMVSIVNHYAETFEVAMQNLIKEPATQQVVIDFFATLTQNGYLQRVKMLGGLIIASGYQPDITEKLFAAAHIESDTDRTDLLENNCKELLRAHPLPPTLLNLIRAYLSNFDIGTLQTGPTRELLQRLQHRNERPELRLPEDLQASVELWGTIAEFIEQPVGSRNRLRDLRQTLRGNQVLQLAPAMRKKLANVLVPALVACVSTEIDLGRVMDNLGRVLMGSGQEAIGPDLLLLEQMAKTAGEKYGQERPPVRLAPYIKVVLGEACNIPSLQKEEWIDRCLQALLKQLDAKTRNALFKNNPAFWPDEIFAEWNAYLTRSGAKAVNAALKRFRAALQNRGMSEIVAAYNPILDTSKELTRDERSRLALAQRFVQAYNANNDAALAAAYQAIADYPYHAQLRCSQEQFDRLTLAQQLLSSVSKASAPMPAVRPSNLPQPAQYTSPSTPPPGEPPAVPAANQRFVAVVKGITITHGWFTWVATLKLPYTQSRITSLKERIQQLDWSNQQQDRQELNRRKQELQELQELEKLLRDDQQLRLVVLNDLVENTLIQEGMATVLKRDQRQAPRFDPEPDLPKILTRLSQDHGRSISVLRSNDKAMVADIKEVLRIFRRRELLADFLAAGGLTSLDEWLKERRRSEAANIQVDYEQAGINPPKGSGGHY